MIVNTSPRHLPLNAAPVLPSLDFGATRAFYAFGLGFEEAANAQHDYMVMRLGDMEVHFWHVADPQHCYNSSVFFRSDRLSDLRRSLTASGILPVTSSDLLPPDVEFHLHDPHGNLLMFARST